MDKHCMQPNFCQIEVGSDVQTQMQMFLLKRKQQQIMNKKLDFWTMLASPDTNSLKLDRTGLY